jgi:hypothetical protein
MLYYLILSIIALMMDVSRPLFVLMMHFTCFLGSGGLNLSSIITDYLIFRGLRLQIKAYSDYFLAYSDFYRGDSDFSNGYSDQFSIYSDYFTIPPQFKLPITFICKKQPRHESTTQKTLQTQKNTPSKKSQGCFTKQIILEMSLLHNGKAIDCTLKSKFSTFKVNVCCLSFT